MGTYLPDTGTLGWGSGVGLGLLAPKISLQSFIHHMWIRDQAPHTSLDGCGFFNSVVDRLLSIRFLLVLSDVCSLM